MNEPERERWKGVTCLDCGKFALSSADMEGKCSDGVNGHGPYQEIEVIPLSELTALRERVEGLAGLAGELEAEGFHFAKVNANPNPFQPDPSYGQGLIAASFRLRSLLSGDEREQLGERCPTCGSDDPARHDQDTELTGGCPDAWHYAGMVHQAARAGFSDSAMRSALHRAWDQVAQVQALADQLETATDPRAYSDAFSDDERAIAIGIQREIAARLRNLLGDETDALNTDSRCSWCDYEFAWRRAKRVRVEGSTGPYYSCPNCERTIYLQRPRRQVG